MKQWFVKTSGDDFRGPYSSNQLRTLAVDGRLTPQRLVRLGLEGEWVSARKIQGLFTGEQKNHAITKQGPAIHPSTATRLQPSVQRTKSCPFCGEDVRAEAVKCRFCNEFLNGDERSAHRRPSSIQPTSSLVSQSVSVVVQHAATTQLGRHA